VTHKQATALALTLPCCVCGTKPCEPCHFPKHRGMGGKNAGWERDEWVPMCREHHDALDGRNGVSAVCTAATFLAREAAARYQGRLSENPA